MFIACDIAGLIAAGQSAYVRYVVPTPDDQEATVEYDLDEEDEEWLQKHNLHVSESCSNSTLNQTLKP